MKKKNNIIKAKHEAKTLIKKNTIKLIIATIFIFSAVPVIAEENIPVQTKYPNYSYEFAGVDKWEKFNRKAFAFNIQMSKISRPLSILWASIMPLKGMQMINNAFTNMKYPVRLISSLAQKDTESAKIETKRFAINTTMGIAGLLDPAKDKYHIEPRKDDMQQTLAYYKLKSGNYLVIPFAGQGNVRDLIGSGLNSALTPTTYIGGNLVVSAASYGVSAANNLTLMQPMIKMANNYADPYETAKQLSSIQKYIQYKNIDRRNLIAEALADKAVTTFNTDASNIPADILLNNYNEQSRETDALRTVIFDTPKPSKSAWAESSLWNKDFIKNFKISSIKVAKNHPSCKYRYILQKDKTAPIAIIYPSIGEGIMSDQSTRFARKLYDEGYSVLIFGSSFNWAFVKSMPDGFTPGLPANDAKYLRLITVNALNDVESKYNLAPKKKIFVGTSFGAFTGLFVAQREEKTNLLGISKYIFICPPVEAFYALKQVDKYSQQWKNVSDIKEGTAVVLQKAMIVPNIYNEQSQSVIMPFSKQESDLAISYAMRQKLYDLIFTLEKGKPSKKNELYEEFANMDFSSYVQKYILPKQNKEFKELDYEASMLYITQFLKSSNKYKIYEAVDDCFISPEQINWLKNQTGDKTILFSNGSHLGFLYRPEFMNEFTKDISIDKL